MEEQRRDLDRPRPRRTMPRNGAARGREPARQGSGAMTYQAGGHRREELVGPVRSRPVALRLAVAAVLTEQPLLMPDTDADDGDETDSGPHDEDPSGDDEVDGGHSGPLTYCPRCRDLAPLSWSFPWPGRPQSGAAAGDAQTAQGRDE